MLSCLGRWRKRIQFCKTLHKKTTTRKSHPNATFIIQQFDQKCFKNKKPTCFKMLLSPGFFKLKNKILQNPQELDTSIKLFHLPEPTKTYLPALPFGFKYSQAQDDRYLPVFYGLQIWGFMEMKGDCHYDFQATQ